MIDLSGLTGFVVVSPFYYYHYRRRMTNCRGAYSAAHWVISRDVRRSSGVVEDAVVGVMIAKSRNE
jgi:hypothetical protein